MLTYDTPAVPTMAPEDIISESSLPESFQTLLAAMREILIKRPVCTRRYLQNHVPLDIWKKVGPNAAKQLWQYVGYIWNSGPWRDSICALGVDPRKDKGMRWYQTMMFQVDAESGDTSLETARSSKIRNDRKLAAEGKYREGHIFDGKTVGLDGKVWQLCDITDPLLREMLETSTVREVCHETSDGWLTNGTMAKLRVIMKAKLQMILSDNVDDAEQNEELLLLARTVPDVITAENRSSTIFTNVSKRMIAMAETLRAYTTRPDGSRQGAWGDQAKDQPTRKVLKGGTKGNVSFKLPANKGGRPSKRQKEQTKQRVNVPSWERHSGPTLAKNDVLDPRLKDATAGLEEIERQATMTAFEDNNDDSDNDSNDDSTATSSGSEEDEEDVEGEEDTSQGDVDTSEEAAGEDEEVGGSQSSH